MQTSFTLARIPLIASINEVSWLSIEVYLLEVGLSNEQTSLEFKEL
jgi:hypothetical protein